MRRLGSLLKAAIIAAVLLVPAATHATVIVPAEFRETVNGSDLIAYGRVVGVRPDWSDDHRRIETSVTFEVSTFIKGESDATIVFKVPGGQVGRYRSFMLGAPVFEPGEEAVLFFKSGPDGAPILFGFSQGVFRVRADAVTRRRMVASPALLARSDEPVRLERGSPERRSVPIETFAAQVRAVMAEQRGDVR